MTPVERFWARVLPSSTDGCLLWTGATSTKGYGRFVIGGRAVQAHRFAWEQENGPVPEGLQLDHLCRVRNCVAPPHLEPVTNQENLRRGKAALTHCPNGHSRTPENLRVRAGKGWAECLPCIRVRRRAYNHRNKEYLKGQRRRQYNARVARLRKGADLVLTA